ncbi:MAG: hypothetical protein ACRDT6_12955 [Micromonosporaceae bacterium]
MYSIEIEQEATGQLAALPAEALPSCAELVAMLELTPWSGVAYNQQRPDAPMRTHAFGPQGEGLITYLILDDQRRVVVLRVLWAG